MAKTCEWRQYEKPRGCRKRATKAVGVYVPFGTRVNMTGPDVPVYRKRVVLHCDTHADERVVNGSGMKYSAAIPIEEYLAACEAEDAAAR